MAAQPLAWLSFGLALQQTQTPDATSAAQQAFEQGLAANPSAEVLLFYFCWAMAAAVRLCAAWLCVGCINASSFHRAYRQLLLSAWEEPSVVLSSGSSMPQSALLQLVSWDVWLRLRCIMLS